MNSGITNGENEEAAWIKAYVDVTGVTESQARNVFMYIDCGKSLSTEDESILQNNSSSAATAGTTEPLKLP